MQSRLVRDLMFSFICIVKEINMLQILYETYLEAVEGILH